MSVVEINGLTKDYGNDKGIFDVSFKIEKGEVFGFLGPNGAGKTTTIRHLLGFIIPKEGTCLIEGMDCSKKIAEIQKKIGYILGEINLMEEVTGIQFIKFMAEYRGMKDLGRAEEISERFDLDPHEKIKKMSKGMKQKIGLVVAFMHDPAVFILDEPTSGLDPLMQSEFINLIIEEKKRGKTILMSSHMFEEVEKTCDRVGIIRQGRMVSIEDIDTLKKSKQKIYIITFKNHQDAYKFQKESFTIRNADDNVVEVVIKHEINELISCLNNYELMNFDIAHQSLEEIFMQFYGGNQHVQ